MSAALRAQAANALTALRVALTPVFVAAVWAAADHRRWGCGAALLFLVIAASDVCDGRLARRWGAVSRGGRTFDHLADLGFLLTALATYVGLGITPWWVPAVIAAAFGSYLIDSRLPPSPSRASSVAARLGHLGGVGNYVLVGVLAFNVSAGLQWLSPATLAVLYCCVAAYSGGTVVARLVGRLSFTAALLPAPRD